MLWQVIIPQEDKNDSPAATTVDAENWYSALKNGLDKYGMRLSPISSLNCSINQGEGFVVEDTNANVVYKVKPSNGESPPDPPTKTDEEEPRVEATPSLESLEPVLEAPATSEEKEPVEEATTSKNIAETVLEVPLASGAEDPAEDATSSPEEEEPPRISNQIEHKVMFSKDEAADDGSGIFYRERLISVPQDTSKEEAGRLIMEFYQQLKGNGSFDGNKLFVSIQIYDHEFEEQANKPAVAALTWKEWTPKKPQILFPLSGDKGVTFSKLPPPPAADEPEPRKSRRKTSRRPVPDGPIEPVIVAEPIAPSDETEKTTNEPIVLTQETQPLELSTQIEKEKPEPEKVIGQEARALESKPTKKEKQRLRPLSRNGIESQGSEDKMVTAFDRMHDIFEVRDHDGAASFTLKLARELVLSEAGSCMLISPGKYELYISAVEGPGAEKIKGDSLSLTEGIVGFATRTGVPVSVTDAQNDPRFNAEVDKKTGLTTRNLICAPIQHEGRIRGALELVNSAAGFSQKDIDILSYIAGALAEYIDTSLPSRQADFSDKEFIEQERTRTGKNGKKKVSKKPSAGRAKSKSFSGGSKAKENASKTDAGSRDAKEVSIKKSTKSVKTDDGKSSGGKDKKVSAKRKKSRKKKNRRK